MASFFLLAALFVMVLIIRRLAIPVCCLQREPIMSNHQASLTYLKMASGYLAQAAADEGWTGACIAMTALLHFTLASRYPDTNCQMVAGWSQSALYPDRRKHIELPYDFEDDHSCSIRYAHYWLEIATPEGDLIVDCARQASRKSIDPLNLFLDSAFVDEHHAVRKSRSFLPLILPEDIPADALYLNLDAVADVRDFRGNISGIPARAYLRNMMEFPDVGFLVVDIVGRSGGLLLLP